MVEAILDKTLEFRLAYWARAFAELSDVVDVVVEYDDLGSGTSTLMSPSMYRKYLKPRHKQLYTIIKSHSHAAVFLHSCGAIHALIPDFIDAGIDILNPIQVSATNMGDGKKLKQEFGRDLVFWGGGINTQETAAERLPRGRERGGQEEDHRSCAGRGVRVCCRTQYPAGRSCGKHRCDAGGMEGIRNLLRRI